MKDLCPKCPEEKQQTAADFIKGKKVQFVKTTECLIPLLKAMTGNKYCDIPPEGCK